MTSKISENQSPVASHPASSSQTAQSITTSGRTTLQASSGNPNKSTPAGNRLLRFTPLCLALLMFVMPFVTVSCQGQKLASFSGVQMAIGTSVDQRDPMTGRVTTQKIHPVVGITVALVATAVAALLALGESSFGSAAVALIAFIGLMLGKTDLDGQALRSGSGLLAIQYESGFVLTAILLIVGAAIAGAQYWNRKNSTAPAH